MRFLTPAFLGNAEQSGQWRTPPFKALLRQWWRVAYAADHGFAVNVAEMRRDEGLLFGHAWLEGDTFERNGKSVTTAARKSEIRLRLSSWAAGKLTNWHRLEQGVVHHPETEKTGNKVGPHAYLGFGPLDGRGGTKLSKANAAIQAGESATLSLAVPEEYAPRIEHALSLMDRYGTLGGRSRNGWGSLALLPSPASGREAGGEGAAVPLRDWRQALALDWPHAIGADETGPLIWQTKPFDGWQALMKELAIIKIGLRTQFKFPEERPDGQVHERHWLSYPVTKHNVRAWDSDKLRLPNSLRFKVRAAPEQPQKLVGLIFHVPSHPPWASEKDQGTIKSVWRRVHSFLDAPIQKLTRVPF